MVAKTSLAHTVGFMDGDLRTTLVSILTRLDPYSYDGEMRYQESNYQPGYTLISHNIDLVLPLMKALMKLDPQSYQTWANERPLLPLVFDPESWSNLDPEGFTTAAERSTEQALEKAPSQWAKVNPKSFLRACERWPAYGIAYASEDWVRLNQTSFLEACLKHPLTALLYNLQTWKTLDPENAQLSINTYNLGILFQDGLLNMEHLEAFLEKDPEAYKRWVIEKGFMASEEILKLGILHPAIGDELLEYFLEEYPETILQQMPSIWAEKDPEAFLRSCRENESLWLHKTWEPWNNLDHEGLMEACERELATTMKTPGLMNLWADINPKAFVNYCAKNADVIFSEATWETPDKWLELSPDTLAWHLNERPEIALTLVRDGKSWVVAKAAPDVLANLAETVPWRVLDEGGKALAETNPEILLKLAKENQHHFVRVAHVVRDLDSDVFYRLVLKDIKQGEIPDRRVSQAIASDPDARMLEFPRYLFGYIQANLTFMEKETAMASGWDEEIGEATGDLLTLCERNPDKLIKEILRGERAEEDWYQIAAAVLDGTHKQQLVTSIINTPGQSQAAMAWATSNLGVLPVNLGTRKSRNRDGAGVVR